MSAIPKKKLTEAEYLSLERTADFKSEFFNGEMFAMAGASREHNELKDNMIGEIFSRLKGGPCRTYSSDQRVKVSRTGLYTYPDLLIVCGTPEFEFDKDVDTLLNPQVIFEILSESTESYDRGAKFQQYWQVPSLREYVLVSQDKMLMERFVRQPDDSWLLTTFDDAAGDFTLATISVRVPLVDIYRGVEISEQPLR
jgi:Uma2 family endonuclease